MISKEKKNRTANDIIRPLRMGTLSAISIKENNILYSNSDDNGTKDHLNSITSQEKCIRPSFLSSGTKGLMITENGGVSAQHADFENKFLLDSNNAKYVNCHLLISNVKATDESGENTKLKFTLKLCSIFDEDVHEETSVKMGGSGPLYFCKTIDSSKFMCEKGKQDRFYFKMKIRCDGKVNSEGKVKESKKSIGIIKPGNFILTLQQADKTTLHEILSSEDYDKYLEHKENNEDDKNDDEHKKKHKKSSKRNRRTQSD